MRILIVEDEPLAARRLQRLVEEVEPEAEILAVLDSVASTLVWLDQGHRPDLFLMDIELLDGSAFEIFEQRPIDLPVVFCTAYDEHAIRAFKVNSIGYLLKPIDREALGETFAKLHRLRPGTTADPLSRLPEPPVPWPEVARIAQGHPLARKSSFVVKKGSRLYPVPVVDVAFFWTAQKIVRLTTHGGESFFLDLTLEELEKLVDPNAFFRISRQVLLAYTAVVTVRVEASRLHVEIASETLPRSDVSLQVSRERASAFRAWLDR